jgi:hypothetical protein
MWERLNMNNYILSMTKKFNHFFGQKEISKIIYLHDEDDNERLDHVIFFEKVDGNDVGIFIRGINPLISGNRIYDLDDFNLFASYEEGLIECEENFILKVEYINLFFSTQYNELLGFYLSENNKSNSLLIIFMNDEIYMDKNCCKSHVREAIEERHSLDGFITYEKKGENEWEKINF